MIVVIGVRRLQCLKKKENFAPKIPSHVFFTPQMNIGSVVPTLVRMCTPIARTFISRKLGHFLSLCRVL